MGFDTRCVDAMLKLGYRVFPFEAFDAVGQITDVAEVRFPADVQSGLGRIASNPFWTDLYRTLAPLQRADKVFMAGIGLVNDRVQVALFKSATTVTGPAEAMNWAESYHGSTERTLHAYAGRSYLVDPAWAGLIDKAKSKLSVMNKDLPGAGQGSELQSNDSDRPAADIGVEAAGAIPWLAFALDVLSEIVTKMTVRTRVLTTVVWYPPVGVQADVGYGGRWEPIHANLQTGWLSGHRSAHLIWNPVGYPVTISGQAVAWRGPGMDMPNDAVEWCQALRPLANCTNRPQLQSADDAPCVSVDVGEISGARGAADSR